MAADGSGSCDNIRGNAHSLNEQLTTNIASEIVQWAAFYESTAGDILGDIPVPLKDKKVSNCQ